MKGTDDWDDWAGDDAAEETPGRIGPVKVSKDPVHVRRRRGVAVALLGVLVLGGCGVNALVGGDGEESGDAGPATAPAPDGADSSAATGEESGEETDGGEATGEAAGAEDAEATTEAEDRPDWWVEPAETEQASDSTQMVQKDYFTAGTPKSVMSNDHGLIITNNMMYSHTSLIFDARSHELLEEVSDHIDPADFGLTDRGPAKGSPVEAVWTADGRYAYVSQYTMYGEGWGVEGFDACTNTSGVGDSAIYRFDTEEMAWDQVFLAGAVPKFMALTPDESKLVVSNWCDYEVSVIDTESTEKLGSIDLGAHPRGIVTLPDNETALVTAMNNRQVWRADLEEMSAEVAKETGTGPRHMNLSPDGETVYLTVAKDNLVQKLDVETMEVLDEVNPGAEPRSMAISPDGSALYVVNYYEATVSKIRTSDMTVLQKVNVDATPIGIDYDRATNTVWVACYNGGMYVFDDQTEALES